MADSHALEKDVRIQDAPISPLSPRASTLEPLFDHAAERGLIRKLDLRVLPVLWILSLVNFLDRANIGNAKVAGMEKELNLIGQRFNICVWVFNLGYLVAGIPLQIMFKRYGPKTLCVMMFIWGITVIGCGLVKRWEQLVVCRLLEGICESAYTAGAAYLIGTYYSKREYLTRYVFFFTSTIIAGAVNGFISSLLAKMGGTAGYAAWRWIFIIEGCLTILVSLASLPLIPPFPEHCKFLSPDMKSLMLARIKADGGHVADDSISFKKTFNILSDWKIWAGVAMYLGVLENANSLANFQPTVLKGLGYTATQAQIHTIPVYIVGAVFTLIFSYTSEWRQRRYYFYMFGWAVLATGLCVMIAYPASAKVRYMGMFFIASGCYLAMPVTIIWVSVNSGSGYKRALAIAAIVNFGTAGALITSNVYLLSETPKFRTGFSTGFGLACMGAIAATVYWVACQKENKKRDRQRLEMPDVLEGDMKGIGDSHPDFRYAL